MEGIKAKEGSRGSMENMRRISIVGGGHRRTKSGVSNSHVAGGGELVAGGDVPAVTPCETQTQQFNSGFACDCQWERTSRSPRATPSPNRATASVAAQFYPDEWQWNGEAKKGQQR